MKEQCKTCIHRDVCAYREHYKDVVELYEKAQSECGKYPWFICVRCLKFLNKNEPQENEDKE